MAHLIRDRVRETATTTGTGSFTLAGAVSGFVTWASSGFANNDTGYYCIEHQSANEWEVGLGTWTTGGVLVRTTPLAGSAATPVSFTAGTKHVFLTDPASAQITIADLTALSPADPAADYLPIVDATDGTTKKVLPQDLGLGTLYLRPMVVPIIAGGTANLTLTNQANTEAFLAGSNRNILKLDLSLFTQVRLTARVITSSASANSPRIYAEYSTTFTTTVGSFSDIGTSVVNCSMASTGIIDSGWVDLAAGAKADVFVTVMQNGGDGVADPALGHVALHFR